MERERNAGRMKTFLKDSREIMTDYIKTPMFDASVSMLIVALAMGGVASVMQCSKKEQTAPTTEITDTRYTEQGQTGIILLGNIKTK